jgi:hypothetical protein
MDRADAEAGYLMAMPYTMAVAVQSLHKVFANRGIDTGDYVIPVTVDNRPRCKTSAGVFFNNVSLMLFRIQAHEVEDFSILLKSIKEQMYDQVKAGLPQDIWEASFLLRIVPLPVLSYLLRVYLKGEVASFCFSFVRETDQMPTHFMGNRIFHSYQIPRVPVPPGLGVFFHQCQGRLNVYLSCTQGLLRQDERAAIMDAVRRQLGG